MPLPDSLARFNRVVTNRISRPLAGRLPWFALLIHRGRVSGAEYRTPVNAWLGADDIIVALTYGRDTDWLKNLTAAEGGIIVTRGSAYPVGAPIIIGLEGMKRMPAVARPILRAIDVDEFALVPLLRLDRPT